MMLLEAQLEKQTDSHLISEEMEQVHKQLRSLAGLLELYYIYIKWQKLVYYWHSFTFILAPGFLTS